VSGAGHFERVVRFEGTLLCLVLLVQTLLRSGLRLDERATICALLGTTGSQSLFENWHNAQPRAFAALRMHVLHVTYVWWFSHYSVLYDPLSAGGMWKNGMTARGNHYKPLPLPLFRFDSCLGFHGTQTLPHICSLTQLMGSGHRGMTVTSDSRLGQGDGHE